MSTTRTTPSQELSAVATYRGDWDENGTTSIYLPDGTAETLLERRGWVIGSDCRWVSPNGLKITDTAEALQIALLAETR